PARTPSKFEARGFPHARQAANAGEGAQAPGDVSSRPARVGSSGPGAEGAAVSCLYRRRRAVGQDGPAGIPPALARAGRDRRAHGGRSRYAPRLLRRGCALAALAIGARAPWLDADDIDGLRGAAPGSLVSQP